LKNKKELEGFLIENLDVIEECMMILGRQIQTNTGYLDILAIDDVLPQYKCKK
jgi:RecB family endonuclease NucS